MLKNALRFSHELLKQSLVEGDIVVDGTVGNGGDTILLATLVGERGKVYGFDIQSAALEKTKEKLLLTGLSSRVKLIQEGHENVSQYIPEEEQIAAAVFNLGYLPSGDKSIVTTPSTTLEAIQQLLPKLRKGGLLLIVVYWGHEGGKEEKTALLQYLPTLPQKEYDVLHYQFLNQKNAPPFLLAVEKK